MQYTQISHYTSLVSMSFPSCSQNSQMQRDQVASHCMKTDTKRPHSETGRHCVELHLLKFQSTLKGSGQRLNVDITGPSCLPGLSSPRVPHSGSTFQPGRMPTVHAPHQEAGSTGLNEREGILPCWLDHENPAGA